MDHSSPNSGGTPKSEAVKQLSGWRKNSTPVHWQFMDGSSVIGVIQWYDRVNIGIDAEGLGPITIPKHALQWYAPANQIE